LKRGSNMYAIKDHVLVWSAQQPYSEYPRYGPDVQIIDFGAMNTEMLSITAETTSVALWSARIIGHPRVSVTEHAAWTTKPSKKWLSIKWSSCLLHCLKWPGSVND
jgi:hypothetical protein